MRLKEIQKQYFGKCVAYNKKLCQNNTQKYRDSLWGRVRFPTGGIAREPETVSEAAAWLPCMSWGGQDSVRFRSRQYSLDEKRRVVCIFLCVYDGC